ncbi:MAG: amidohydrolase family protein [Candidatus Caldarchaeum sp.]
MIIDAFTHICSKKYLAELRNHNDPRVRTWAEQIGVLDNNWPQFTDLKKRITDMDKHSVDIQVACIHNRIDPTRFLLSHSEEIRLCSILNDTMAQLTEESQGRVICLGTAPLNSLKDGGIDEMRRAVKDLGIKGFMVLTNIGGVPIDKFIDFWKTAKELEAVVYIHPTDPNQTVCRSYENEFDLIRTLGWPFETSLILLRLVLSGILEKLIGIRILAHHAGGMIPFFMGRITELYSKSMTQTRSDQIEQVRVGDNLHELFKKYFYYDTAVGDNVSAIRCAYEVLGAERLMFGTDYPYGPEGKPIILTTYPSLLKSLNIARDELEYIIYLNAKKFLQI